MRIPLLSSFPLLLLSLAASAQNGMAPSLNLFEPTEQPQSQEQQPRQVRRDQANQEPAFTLRGTGRFGDQYVTSLQSRDGSRVNVKWREGQQANVEGYPAYTVLDVNPRSISLQLPAEEACFPNRAKGVDCASGANIAILSLATATALPPPQQPVAVDPNAQAQTEGAQPTADGTQVLADGTEVLLNPFTGEPQFVPQLTEEERQARDERARRRQEALRNFQPVRIPDDQIPPGMRRISTPFGDRLVPAEE